MAKVIYKYPVSIVDEQEIRMPMSAKPLSVGVQGDGIVMWCLVDIDEERYGTKIRVVGTGHRFDDAADFDYVGTVQMGPLVWHVFFEN